MTLLDLIRREIELTGPMSVVRYMELCLGHPEHGYYMTRDPLGRRGDFTTAPEISQLFGEMVGVWVVSRWQAMGEEPFQLVELGPGRGTLMADVLAVMKQAGAVPEAIWLVETSPVLRAEQAAAVPSAKFATTLHEIPPCPMILIANEFFDALPVRQHIASPEGVREVQIGLTADGKLQRGASGQTTSGEVHAGWGETSAVSDEIAGGIGARLRDAKGAALIVDYGYTMGDRPAGPTLQALRAHEKVDPLKDPGECDLTTLVDFDRLTRALRLPAWCTGQGAFLARMGIGMRAEALARRTPEAAGGIADGLERLTSADEMGTLFKVLGAQSPGMPPPPGFEE